MSRDLFAVASFDGYLLSINPAWSRQLGWTEEELLAKPFASIIHPQDLAETANVVAILQAGDPVHQFHVRLLRADGSDVSYAWSAVPEMAPRNGTFYTSGRDITDEMHDTQRELNSLATTLQSMAPTDPGRTAIIQQMMEISGSSPASYSLGAPAAAPTATPSPTKPTKVNQALPVGQQ